MSDRPTLTTESGKTDAEFGRRIAEGIVARRGVVAAGAGR